ncbi:hypothetical protein FHP22_11145 [Acinetobacter indicus]|uniref:hypothetical protein n=1 Tax=Acinetobacter TaxID=469 RepID=UPI000FDBABAC|nr:MULTISPECIES: hypothetical protein [Acinetobacter]QFS18011.1 hypothetical protein FHP22_11145 [Acinetobacter indicus]RVT36168.1 hypothetical protein ENC20_05275 [Acinetobacter indicus]RVT55778.1 hypothetical protein ENC21_00990 [Acinetobacter indicus]UNW03646.1 hypothetical protein MOW12_11105 [Acinetobacter indicus]
MTKKKAPSNLFAPVVIAGITLGFLASAYKFIFAKTQNQPAQTADDSGDTGQAATKVDDVV